MTGGTNRSRRGGGLAGSKRIVMVDGMVDVMVGRMVDVMVDVMQGRDGGRDGGYRRRVMQRAKGCGGSRRKPAPTFRGDGRGRGAPPASS